MAHTAMRSDAVRNVERVLEAACSVLAKNPAASMEQVAAASGVHRSTVYRRFPTRDELVAAILERALREVSAMVATAADGEPDEAKLQRMCEQVMDLGGRYGFLLTYVRIAELGPDPVGITKLMRSYQRAGIVRADLPAAWLASAFTTIGAALLDRAELAGRGPSESAMLLMTTFLDGARQR
jgi:AcrR family transcriptional regulator